MIVGMPVLVGLIAVALLFDFLNGLHDSANSIATVVATRVLRPVTAVLWAAFFNFIAFTVFGLHVADTMGNGVVDASLVDPAGDLRRAGRRHLLERADLVARHPVEQQPRAGRRAGRRRHRQGGLGRRGLGRPRHDRLRAIVLSPLIGLVLAMLAGIGGVLVCGPRRRPSRWTAASACLQFVSSSLLSLGHGGNDAQKTMGIITVLLYSQGVLRGEFHVPFWVVLSCQSRDGARHLVRRLAHRADRGLADHASDADAGLLRRDRRRAGAVRRDLARASRSRPRTPITGAMVGVGAARRVSAVRWGIARGIVVAWVITLPASALVAAACYGLGILAMRLTSSS